MDDKTTDLLMGYFKNSTDAVKEIVTQLSRSNQVITDLARKIDEVKGEFSEFDLEEIKKELRFLIKENEQLIKAFFDENKANTKNELVSVKDDLNKEINSANTKLNEKVDKFEKSLMTLCTEIKDAIDKVEWKLIIAASGAVSLVSIIFEFIKVFFFEKKS